MPCVYDCESRSSPINSCNCSKTEDFPTFDMAADGGRRSSAMSGLLTAPQNIGGAFERANTNIQLGYNDPRLEEDLFRELSPTGTSAPSSSCITQGYFCTEPNQTATRMSRVHSENNRAMSASGFPAQDRSPVRSMFAAQLNGSTAFDYSHPGSHVTAYPTNMYRDPPTAPPSFTGSSVSRDARSPPSSNASYQYPHTPSDYESPGFGRLTVTSSPTDPFFTMAEHDVQMSQSYSPPGCGFQQSSRLDMAPPPMAKTKSSSSQPKEKKFWCDVVNCPRDAGFGTRNDLDRHRLAVHKIPPPNSNTKVFVCQGLSCLQQGKSKIWPRKDNFKNHCKAAHSEVDADALINRSELLTSSLTPQELEGLTTEDNARPHPAVLPDLAKKNGNTCSPPALRISIAPDSRLRQRDRNTLPCPSPDHLSPIDGRHHGMARHSSMQTSPSATSGRSDATMLQQHSHHRSFSTPNAPGLHKSVSYPFESTKSTRSAAKASSCSVQDVEAFLVRNGASAEMIATLSASARGLKRQRDEDKALPNLRHECPYPECGKAFKRACDLKKHKTRHTRPWGCTDSSCLKLFGSKNDWKRHELSRHFQNTSWICGEHDSSSAVDRCLVNCSSAKRFADHLRNAHAIADEDVIKEKQKSRHIGRNWAVAVWCGFCKQIIQLTGENQDAWNERFDHIDSHLNGTFVPTEKQLSEDPTVAGLRKQELSIFQWYPPDSDKPRRELPMELQPDRMGVMATTNRSAAVADDDSEDADEEDDDAEGSDDDDDGSEASPPASGLIDPSVLTQSPTKRRRVVWYCSGCKDGPHDERVHTSCPLCRAPRSPTAAQEFAFDSDED